MPMMPAPMTATFMLGTGKRGKKGEKQVNAWFFQSN
jgi:hypothetical protein